LKDKINKVFYEKIKIGIDRMGKHVYEGDFFNYVNTTSLRSAKAFLKNVKLPVEVKSILDVGCGKGAWLSQWRELYTKDIQGLDGSYVDKQTLLIPKDNFLDVDLTDGFQLNRKFSLVQCLEVAEHLDEKFADILVKSIISHGDIVLFSAAQPGQGGEHHVNEQKINYWVKKFSNVNYVCCDYIRPQIKGVNEIEPWYRFNTVLFINSDILVSLPEEVQYAVKNENYDFTIGIDKQWLFRNRLLALLPTNLIDNLSKIKQRIIPILKK
jgi:2-polyprenyl-3-methyl-5-hydroxy-6-metoxy-1,4-benzoquinol methylase